MARARSDLCSMLGITSPILLGPFGGLSSTALTGAVSNLGGLGSFGCYGYTPEQILATAEELRGVTGAPFALNLWCHTGEEVSPAGVDLEVLTRPLATFFEDVGLALPEPPEQFLPDAGAQFDAALRARVPVLSTVYGPPPADVLERARAQGTVMIGTATTVPEALALQEAGVDAIVATGMEAAGHRTAFLQEAERGLVGTFSLVPQVVDAVNVPVIAAGGIADRRGVAAAFALGASGVQVGTAFLGTAESAANESHKEAIATTAAHESVLTRAMSGRLSRGAPNRATRAIEAAGAIGPFPAQNWLTGQFRKEAGRRGLGELQSLWLGQSAPLARYATAALAFAELRAGVPG